MFLYFFATGLLRKSSSSHRAEELLNSIKLGKLKFKSFRSSANVFQGLTNLTDVVFYLTNLTFLWIDILLHIITRRVDVCIQRGIRSKQYIFLHMRYVFRQNPSLRATGSNTSKDGKCDIDLRWSAWKTSPSLARDASKVWVVTSRCSRAHGIFPGRVAVSRDHDVPRRSVNDGGPLLCFFCLLRGSGPTRDKEK